MKRQLNADIEVVNKLATKRDFLEAADNISERLQRDIRLRLPRLKCCIRTLFICSRLQMRPATKSV